jgi:hypothetical protein
LAKYRGGAQGKKSEDQNRMVGSKLPTMVKTN